MGRPRRSDVLNRSRFTDRRYSFSGQRTVRDGHLVVTCWCEDAYVEVPAEDVLAGRTMSCGRVCCTPMVTA